MLPLVGALPPHLPSDEGWSAIQLCPGCQAVGYCGARCRLAARVRHGEECALLAAHAKRSFPHRAWFLARACLTLRAEGWDARDRINSTRSRAFRDLLDRE